MLDLGWLPDGLYFMVVTNDNKISVKKVIVSKK
jgi:hypothetical protein